MKTTARDDDKLRILADEIAAFEADGSIENTGTGSRREGESFERLVLDFWSSAHTLAERRGASARFVRGQNRRHSWCDVRVGERSLILPAKLHVDSDHVEHRWLDLEFGVSDLVGAFPGTPCAIERYSPSSGPFSGNSYPQMFTGLSTRFDGAILLVESGALKEKILLEYKTAKSSTGRQIDGNAHERLSFQVMQYLEIATRYPRCSMVVLANSAFVNYRNKYHVNFHVQADRLSNFGWFTMRHVCESERYLSFVDGLIGWLEGGEYRPAGGLT